MGANTNFNYSNGDKIIYLTDLNNNQLSANIGKHLNEKWLVGAGLSFLHHNYGSENFCAFRIFTRKYYPLGKKLSFFTDFYSQYGVKRWMRYHFDEPNEIFHRNIFSVGLQPGLSYKLKDNLKLELGLGNFSFDRSEYEMGLNINLFSGRIGVGYTF